jgi:hypothetical protein
LDFYGKYLRGRDSDNKTERQRANHFYWLFRQGLDMLDLDDVVYQILGMNPNSIGNWLPKMVAPVQEEGFFKIPKTTIIRVPQPLLQLSRLDYELLTPATIAILDRFCYKAFDLKDDGDYFVKTGTFSFKFDFRNAHVTGAKEVRELGEYLLFIQNYAVNMAGYDLTEGKRPSAIGVSTTNEWCVREYIKSDDAKATIYNGMPLRTEYRAFVDFDTKQVLGIHPYWDSKVMKERFEKQSDANTPQQKHDSVTYRVCEPDLKKKYEENKDKAQSPDYVNGMKKEMEAH